MSLERRINSVYIKSGLWLRPMRKKAETPAVPKKPARQPQWYTDYANRENSPATPPRYNPAEVSPEQWEMNRRAAEPYWAGVNRRAGMLASIPANIGRGAYGLVNGLIPESLGGTGNPGASVARARSGVRNWLYGKTWGLVGESNNGFTGGRPAVPRSMVPSYAANQPDNSIAAPEVPRMYGGNNPLFDGMFVGGGLGMAHGGLKAWDKGMQLERAGEAANKEIRALDVARKAQLDRSAIALEDARRNLSAAETAASQGQAARGLAGPNVPDSMRKSLTEAQAIYDRDYNLWLEAQSKLNSIPADPTRAGRVVNRINNAIPESLWYGTAGVGIGGGLGTSYWAMDAASKDMTPEPAPEPTTQGLEFDDSVDPNSDN